MGKRGRGKAGAQRFKNNSSRSSDTKKTKDEFVLERDMDDEIDAFHRQRDFVPMDVNGDAGDSDSDDELPILDNKDLNGEEDEDDEDDHADDYYDPALIKKITRAQKGISRVTGGVDDEMDDEEDEGEGKMVGWGRNKNIYYNADNVDYELQSDDDELLDEEEKAVLEMQKEEKMNLRMEDVGLEESDEDDSDMEPTLEERAKNKDAKSKRDAEGVFDMTHEIPRDLSALPPDEQMDAINNYAPELVDYLSELNDAHVLLESEINPLLKEVKENVGSANGGMHYLEVKQLLLVSYCQAITFYLLLKSEGQSTHDHPVIERISQIKDLLDKTKELDKNLPSDYKDIIKRRREADTVSEFASADEASPVDVSTLRELDETQKPIPVKGTTLPSKTQVEKDSRSKGRHEKHQDEARLGHQSKEMLKFRASLEDKFREKGVLGTSKPISDNTQKQRRQKVNGQFETFDDFSDDVDGRVNSVLRNGSTIPLQTKRISELITSATAKKPKVVSGEDDLVGRGDIGERRRMHELQVLRKSGIESEDGPGNEQSSEYDDMEDHNESEESEDEFYQQVKKQKFEKKLASKQKTLSSDEIKRPAPEESIDGKRHISYQMEKNRGLTRSRKKLIKNPRKKYKLKHQKAVVSRKGQVRDIRKPTGPYGGETSGINARISRSIRLKS